MQLKQVYQYSSLHTLLTVAANNYGHETSIRCETEEAALSAENSFTLDAVTARPPSVLLQRLAKCAAADSAHLS